MTLRLSLTHSPY